MSQQVEVVDLLDDEDEPMASSSRGYGRQPPASAPRSLEEQERLLAAVKSVQSRLEDFRCIGGDIPRELLAQFQALCDQLNSAKKDDVANRSRGTFSGGRGGGDGPSGHHAEMAPSRRVEPPPLRRPDPPPQHRKQNQAKPSSQKAAALAAKADAKPVRAAPKPWNPTRKARLLNRAARFAVDGVEAFDAHGRSLPPALVKPGVTPPNARGNLLYIPRMVDANLWYQLSVRGLGAAFNSTGPFPETVKGFPLNEGLDLSQAEMPRDLSFNDPTAGDITEFQLDDDTRKMIDPRAVLEWENRTHPTKCTEKLAAQLREISAIQAVAVDCLKQQVAQLTAAFREFASASNNSKPWQQRNQEKARIFNEFMTLEQTVEDLDTTTAMVCNRSTVFFNLTSHCSRKIMLDKLEVNPPARHALLHSPSARCLFTDAFKWVTLGPALVMAKPGAEMKITDLGVHLKIGKLGDEIVAPSRDPKMPLPFMKCKKDKHMGPPMMPPPSLRERPAQVQVPLAFREPPPPIFPAAAAALEREKDRVRREASPPWMVSPISAAHRDGGRPVSPPRESPRKSRRSPSPKRRSREEDRRERERMRSSGERRRTRSRSVSRGREDRRDRLESRPNDLISKFVEKPPREDESRRRKRSPSPTTRHRIPSPPAIRHRRSPSPVMRRRRSPSPVAHRRPSPPPVARQRRSPTPPARVRRSPSPVARGRRSPSPRRGRRSASREKERVAEPESYEKRLNLMSEIFDLLGQAQKKRSPSPRRDRARERSPYGNRSSGRALSPLSMLLAQERAVGVNRPNPRY